MLSYGLLRSFSTAWMPAFDHIDEKRLMSFYRLWAVSPELVSDAEFDDIQIHLLECEFCAAIARKYEQKFRELRLLMPGEMA